MTPCAPAWLSNYPSNNNLGKQPGGAGQARAFVCVTGQRSRLEVGLLTPVLRQIESVSSRVDVGYVLGQGVAVFTNAHRAPTDALARAQEHLRDTKMLGLEVTSPRMRPRQARAQ